MYDLDLKIIQILPSSGAQLYAIFKDRETEEKSHIPIVAFALTENPEGDRAVYSMVRGEAGGLDIVSTSDSGYIGDSSRPYGSEIRWFWADTDGTDGK